MKTCIKWTLVIASLLFLVCSCNTSQSERTNVNCIDIDSEITFGQYAYNDFKFIMLEDSEDAIFSNISKVMCDGSRIFILDGNLSTIHVFSICGRLLKKIDNIGQGPGEYIRLRDFDVKDNKIFLYDDMARRILIYNLVDYKYEGGIQTPFFARSFSWLENGNILFVLPKDQGHKQIIVTDSECNIISEYVDFEEDDLDNRTRYALLQKTVHGLVYSKPLKNKVYVFSKIDGTLLEDFLFLIDGEEYDENNPASPNLRITPLILKDGTVLGNYIKGNELFYYQASLNSDKSWVKNVLKDGNKHSDLLLPLCVSGDSLVLSYLQENVYQRMDKTMPLDEKYEEYLENGGYLIGIFQVNK